MNASPNGSDTFMSCVAEQSVNNDESVFQATDIPLSQDSDAVQSPSSDNVQPLLTQAPAQSFSDDDDDVDTDEFQSVNPDMTTATPPSTQDTRNEQDGDVESTTSDAFQSQSPQISVNHQDATTTQPTEHETRPQHASKARPDIPAFAAFLEDNGEQRHRHPLNSDILSASPESMAQSDQSGSPGIDMKGNSFFMTQPASPDGGETSDGFNGAVEMDGREPLASQPDFVQEAVATRLQESTPNSQRSDGFDGTIDMDCEEPLSSPIYSASKTTTPRKEPIPSSPANDESDSSSDESDTSTLRGEAYMAKVARNRKRNEQWWISQTQGGLRSFRQAQTPMSVRKAQTPVNAKASPDGGKCDDIDPPTGMLLQDPACNTLDTGADIDEIYERFPHREFQIKTLVSLIGIAMGQTIHQGNDPYVPAPIFVSGPSGSGKTSVVRDVVETLQRHHLSRLDASEGRVIGTAYVNCAAIEPSSLEAVLESAYSQLAPCVEVPRRSSHARRGRKKQKRRKQSTCDAPVKSPSQEADMMCVQSNGEYNSDNEADMEDKMEAFKTQLSQVEADEKKNPVSPPKRRKTRHSMNGTNDRKRRAPDANVPNAQKKSIRKVESATKSHGAPVAFGRLLTPLFGPSSPLSPAEKPGSAFLILDHAERLFTLSANKQGEPNNFLAQLLLLPQVMELNLTLIVVSHSALLDCSRINNSASVQKALGTIANGVRPVRVCFPAYRGKPVFKTILKQPNIIELIVGRQSHSLESNQDNPRNTFKESTIDSFLDTVVQSLSSVTRDIREMIRVGRGLWPTYILPLDPRHIRTTLDAARRRRTRGNKRPEIVESVLLGNSNAAKNNVSIEDLQKELLAILDEAFLPRMKKCLEEELFLLKGDDSHLAAGSPGSAATSSCQHDLPYLSKCILLAAFVCQSNKPDKDKALFTIQKNGKKNNRQGHRVSNNDAEGLAFGSTTWEQQRLKMLRPRTFPLERMLSVFVNIVGLIGGEEKLRLTTNSTADPRELLSSIGSTCFFENLARLREIGLLHEVLGPSTSGGEGFTSFDGINMMSTMYWCELNREDAETLAASVDFPLANFLL